jgi:hypothetical protein
VGARQPSSALTYADDALRENSQRVSENPQLRDVAWKRFHHLLRVAANGRPPARKAAPERPEHRRGCLPRALGGVRGKDPLSS